MLSVSVGEGGFVCLCGVEKDKKWERDSLWMSVGIGKGRRGIGRGVGVVVGVGMSRNE